MKTVALITALVGVASAHVPAHLARRADGISDECRDAREAVSSANRPQGTGLSELSVSYYKTATPTASGTTTPECGWITAVPESAYTIVTEDLDDEMDWVNDLDNRKLMVDLNLKCYDAPDLIDTDDIDIDGPVCLDELSLLFKNIKEKTGWELQGIANITEDDYTDAKDKDTTEPSIASPGFQTSAAAVLLATLLGAFALL